MKESELLEQLEESYEAFMVPLRMGDGFEQKPFDEFCKLLNYCANTWQANASIPKRAAMIFVDAFSSMISSSYLYDDAKKEQIYPFFKYGTVLLYLKNHILWQSIVKIRVLIYFIKCY